MNSSKFGELFYVSSAGRGSLGSRELNWAAACSVIDVNPAISGVTHGQAGYNMATDTWLSWTN